MDFITDNWTVIAPLVVAAIGLFWPQLKPIIGPIIAPKPKPDPVVDPDPAPSPSPRPAVSLALQLAMALLEAMRKANNPEGVKLAKEAAKAAIDQEEAAK